VASSGEKLLSALRRAKSKSALYEVPVTYFTDDERAAFDWLRSFVETHQAWPGANVFRQETGITPLITKEPLGYYMDDSRKRALWQASLDPYKHMKGALETKDPDRFVDLCRQVVMAASQFSSQRSGLTTLADSLNMVGEDYKLASAQAGLRGVTTGFPFLDESTDGFQNANLYSFVARTGVGKTWLLIALAMAAHLAGYSVLFLSMEMGIVQVARRALGMLSGYNPKLIRQGKLSTRVAEEMQAQIEAYQGDETAPFYWMAGNFKKTVDALRIAVHETEPDIIFADASYLLKPSDRTKFNARHELLNDVMEGLADITTSVNRPIVQSIQFNRTAIKPKGQAGNSGEDEQGRRNPISHLALEKIGGTDTVGQISAGVYGIAEGDAPFERTKRYCGTLKGREGETGWFEYSYEFQPVRFKQLRDHTSAQNDTPHGEAPSMDYMHA
jgi:replicative DNA helicase